MALCAFQCYSYAQQAGNFSDTSTSADSRLNAAYSRVIPRLSEPQQEVFLKAQLAWAIFSDKEKALITTLQSENLVTDQFAQTYNVGVIDTRTHHLQATFLANHIPIPPQDTREGQDEALKKVFAECLLRLPSSDQGTLEAAELAWDVYRNEDIAAVVMTYPDPALRDASVVQITGQRISQLNSIMRAVRQIPTVTSPTQALPPPAVPNVSPSPEYSKALVEFQNDAKTVLNALFAKKDSSFFKNADSLKNAPDLPAEISKQVSDLDERYSVLLKKHDADKLFEPESNESATIELLYSWSEFTQRLKAGNVVDAELAIQRAVSQRPTDIAAVYLPLWQTVGSWHDLFAREEATYYDHIDKGDALAGHGKDSAAIKEYQAAYAIIANPTVLENIKKLREQSLGL